jgi:hypothetical protein
MRGALSFRRNLINFMCMPGRFGSAQFNTLKQSETMLCIFIQNEGQKIELKTSKVHQASRHEA